LNFFELKDNTFLVSPQRKGHNVNPRESVTLQSQSKRSTMAFHPLAAMFLLATAVHAATDSQSKCIELHNMFLLKTDKSGRSMNDKKKIEKELSNAAGTAYRGGADHAFTATFTESSNYCMLTYCPGTRSKMRGKHGKTFDDAHSFCASEGLRLCTAEELFAQYSGNHCNECGCDNGRKVWTSTATGCGAGQVVVGKAQCSQKTDKLWQDTRCCADPPAKFKHPGYHYGVGKFVISRYVKLGKAWEAT
jgi:hypothetical protein